jgi:VIT1/CCC1 family predicted Fe2+/Mn2+ transporter
VAGAAPGAGTILLAGVAGLLAGAFSMAAGEYVSMRSQRELFERQIELEKMELEVHPEEEREELALIYRAKGIPEADAERLADTIIADHSVALDTLAREELGLDPSERVTLAGNRRLLRGLRGQRLRPRPALPGRRGNLTIIATVALSTRPLRRRPLSSVHRPQPIYSGRACWSWPPWRRGATYAMAGWWAPPVSL